MPIRSKARRRFARLDALRKKYYDATHHCYAWRLGPRGETFRANDDGEPSGTAGSRSSVSFCPTNWSTA